VLLPQFLYSIHLVFDSPSQFAHLLFGNIHFKRNPNICPISRLQQEVLLFAFCEVANTYKMIYLRQSVISYKHIVPLFNSNLVSYMNKIGIFYVGI